MMRARELQKKAVAWGLKFITIQDLQAYRKRHEKLVEQVAVTRLPTKYGDFTAYGYRNKLNGEHHVALVKGSIGDGAELLCRDRKSTRLNSSHSGESRMPSSA